MKVCTGPPQVDVILAQVLAYSISLFNVNFVRREPHRVCTCGQVIAGRPLVIVTVSSPVSLPPLFCPTHLVFSSSPLMLISMSLT